jgi:dolichol-phosphate mannosyltransferase
MVFQALILIESCEMLNGAQPILEQEQESMRLAPAGPVAVPVPGARAKLAVVVPTLHEAANIRQVLQRVRSSLDPLGIPYELIVVDDDSRDGTAEIVHQISESDPRVRLFVRSNARGLGGAVAYGWARSEAEIIGVIDADLQHPPELLPELWKAVDSGADLALASRYAKPGSLRNWHPVRHGISRLAIWLTLPLQRPEIRVQDPMSGFFLLRRACIRDITLETQGFKILLEILVRGTAGSVAEIPFSFGRREAGASKAGVKEGLDYLSLLRRLRRSTAAPSRVAPTANSNLKR